MEEVGAEREREDDGDVTRQELRAAAPPRPPVPPLSSPLPSHSARFRSDFRGLAMGVVCEFVTGGGGRLVVWFSDCMAVRSVEVGALGCEIWKRGSEGRWAKWASFLFHFYFFVFSFLPDSSQKLAEAWKAG